MSSFFAKWGTILFFLLCCQIQKTRTSQHLGVNWSSYDGDEPKVRPAKSGVLAGDEPAALANDLKGPRFSTSVARNITAVKGKDVQLTCKVFNPSNWTISWLKHDEFPVIISAGRYTYTTDQRLKALYANPENSQVDPDVVNDGSESWILRIQNVQPHDEGRYECQISTRPIKSFFIFLRVVVPVATVLGQPEMYVDVGSTINITCVVRHTPGPPSIIEWLHEGKPIDYTSARGGVSVLTNKADTTVTSLIIQQARPEDGGEYSCQAGELVRPSEIKVHVIHGDNYRSLHTNGSNRNLFIPLTSMVSALLLMAFLGTLRQSKVIIAKYCFNKKEESQPQLEEEGKAKVADEDEIRAPSSSCSSSRHSREPVRSRRSVSRTRRSSRCSSSRSRYLQHKHTIQAI